MLHVFGQATFYLLTHPIFFPLQMEVICWRRVYKGLCVCVCVSHLYQTLQPLAVNKNTLLVLLCLQAILLITASSEMTAEQPTPVRRTTLQNQCLDFH